MNNIIIPDKIQNTAPKPTKAQLIEALVERARAKFNQEQDTIKAKRQVIRQQIDEEARKEFAKFVFEMDSVSVYETYSRPHIDFHLKNELSSFTTPKLTALMAKLKPLQTSLFDEKETKALITAKLKPENPLIGNDDTTKALDALLKTIMQPAFPALDNTVDV